jgi:hypothetical protein
MARAAGSAVIAGDEETKKDTMRVRSAKAEIRQSRIISTSNDWAPTGGAWILLIRLVHVRRKITGIRD